MLKSFFISTKVFYIMKNLLKSITNQQLQCQNQVKTKLRKYSFVDIIHRCVLNISCSILQEIERKKWQTWHSSSSSPGGFVEFRTILSIVPTCFDDNNLLETTITRSQGAKDPRSGMQRATCPALIPLFAYANEETRSSTGAGIFKRVPILFVLPRSRVQ